MLNKNKNIFIILFGFVLICYVLLFFECDSYIKIKKKETKISRKYIINSKNKAKKKKKKI